MKKINNILYSLAIVSTIFSCTGVIKNEETKQYLSEKIVFEVNKNELMNLDDASEQETPVNLLVKLNYNDFTSSSFKNEEERRLYFEKAKNYYSKKNKELVSELNLDDLDYYSSLYSPFISLDITNEELSNDNYHLLEYLDSNSNIEMVYVSDVQSNKPNLTNATNFVGVKPYITNRTYTGEGVVVGILEPSILDADHEDFANTDIMVRNEWYYVESVSNHTTMMGSIIAEKNGIAPDSKLLSVELCGNAVNEIDWLLENGVNVINLSYGDSNPTGNYSSKSAYMDYIINTYKVTMVASSGNTGDTDDYVANPGLGYNVLTVGACSSSYGYSMNFSSYKEVDGPRKPNIVAPGYNISLNSFDDSQSGTSLSAAITTGCVALMMERSYIYKCNPEVVISDIMASSKDPSTSYFKNGLDDNIGAGSLDFSKLVEDDVGGSVLGFSESNQLKSFQMTLSEGDKIKLVAAWLVNADGTVSNTQRTNYDVYIYDSNNNLITSQATNVDCIELIEFETPYTDTYTIKIVKNSVQANTNEYVSISYFII